MFKTTVKQVSKYRPKDFISCGCEGVGVGLAHAPVQELIAKQAEQVQR